MNSTLILITRRFPYFKTEAFLENEIDILGSKFDEIYIFPTEVSEYKREVPSNVFVEGGLAQVFAKKYSRALGTFFSLTFWKNIYDHRSRISTLSDVLLIFQFSTRVNAYIKYFKKRLNFFDNKIVYTYWFSESTYAILKLKELHHLNIEVVSRAHRYDIYENQVATLKLWPYREYCLKNITQVFSISEDGKSFLENNYKIQDKVSISRLGVLDRGILSTRSNSGTFVIVSVSRIEKLKRVDLIYRSLLAYSKANSDKKFEWFHFGDGSQIEVLKNEIAAENVSNFSVNLMGYVKNQSIYEFYETHPVDVFINLSSSEGIPVSIMEAQSFGISVVATDVGGVREIVGQENGVLLESSPSIKAVNEALDKIFAQQVSPKVIKDIWNGKYNASDNYHEFVRQLSSLSINTPSPIEHTINTAL